jgi:Type I phosphodiesterase / nucleotide pyrophosphatase
MVKNKFLCVAVLSGLMWVLAPAIPATLSQAGRQASPRPKLVVLVVVDQLRGDYLTEYGGNFTAGLKRLMSEGAWFKEAAYPYLNTVTCAGHATIGTGTFPYSHGMILNGWLDRATGETPFCTDDDSVQDISYNGLPPGRGDSAKKMLRPALGEQIRDRGGRSIAMSLKPRSAIPLAGHQADAVIWFDDRGGWSTSSAFTKKPVPFLQQFIDGNPLSADYDKTWDRALPLTAYKHEDDAVGEGTPTGWSRTFPHPLGSPGGKPDAAFYSRWQRSPYGDEYLARMAIASIDALQLGRANSTDFLGVSFSSLDSVGHAYGPRSHEVQDLLVRLDRTIGRLLDHLDKTVGRGNYVLGLSADHGVADVPEQSGRGGRQPGRKAFDALTSALVAALGPGDHVASVAYTDIYLAAETNRRLKRDPKLMAAAVEALRALPAVEHVFAAEDVASADARQSPDPVRRAAALSYHKDRSGDLIIVPRDQWLFSSAVTTHGTNRWYDQHVPVIVFGASIDAGEYPGTATPADLVPTLAAVAGVRIDKTDGRALTEALTIPASR